MLTMKELSDAEREKLRKQLEEYHTKKVKKTAREIDLQGEREKRSWISDLIDFILDLFT
jgi:hypothetical protein